MAESSRPALSVLVVSLARFLVLLPANAVSLDEATKVINGRAERHTEFPLGDTVLNSSSVLPEWDCGPVLFRNIARSLAS